MRNYTFVFLLFILALPGYSQTLPSYVPRNGLAAWYSFNGNASDESGHDNHGRMHGGSFSTDRFGSANGSLSLNGISDYVDVRDTAMLNPETALTISLWLLTDAHHGSAGVIGKWNNFGGTVAYNREQFSIDVSDTNKGVNFNIKTKDNFAVHAAEDTVIYNNAKWNHYVGVFDGSTARLYVNGKMVSSKRTSGSIPVFKQDLEIGRIAGGMPTCSTNWYFKGNVDDIGFWGRALTEREVKALYRSCPGFTVAKVTASGQLEFCQGGSVTLKTSTESGATYQWFRNDSLLAGAVDTTYVASKSGKYSVTLSKGDCLSNSDPVDVKVNPLPVPSIQASGPLTFCEGGSVVLTAGGGQTFRWNSGETSPQLTVSQSGTYSVIVMNGNCSRESSVDVVVNPMPVIAFNTPGGFISIQADPIPLVATPSGGAFSGEGFESGKFNPMKAGLGKTTLSYALATEAGCAASLSHSIVVYDTTGTHCTVYDTLLVTRSTLVADTMVIKGTITRAGGPITQNLVTLYPNPARTVLHVSVSNFTRERGLSLQVKNSLGQAVFTSGLQQQDYAIDLAGWGGKGLYLVYLVDKEGVPVEVKKIILQ